MKKMTTFKLIVGSVFASVLVVGSAAHADVLASWGFESNTPSFLPVGWTSTTGFTGATYGGIVPDVGLGSLDVVHASAASVFARSTGDGSGQSINVNRWAQTTDYYQFTVNNPGLATVQNVSYEQNGSASGPRTWYFAYSTDNSTYTSLGDYLLTPTITWNQNAVLATQLSFDLSSFGLNTGTLYFRIVENSLAATGNMTGGAVSTGGTSRIDDFIVTIVPEPTSLSLMGAGLLAWTLIRRRK